MNDRAEMSKHFTEMDGKILRMVRWLEQTLNAEENGILAGYLCEIDASFTALETLLGKEDTQ